MLHQTKLRRGWVIQANAPCLKGSHLPKHRPLYLQAKLLSRTRVLAKYYILPESTMFSKWLSMITVRFFGLVSPCALIDENRF
jgi:hypothetical protein